MNQVEHLLSCLSEECAEVSQRVSKALRFGLFEVQPGQDLTNSERIVLEFTDLLAVVEMLTDIGALSQVALPGAIEQKKEKIRKFMKYAAEECGALKDD